MRQIITNRIAVSTLTLPVAAVGALALWLLLLPLDLTVRMAPLAALTAYVLMEMNSRNTLLRVRSRMISALYTLTAPLLAAALVAVDAGFAGECLRIFATVLVVLVSLAILMRVYERDNAPVSVFHASALLALAALLCPPLVYGLPLMWLQLLVYLHAMSLRNLAASLFGVLVVVVAAVLLRAVPQLLAGELTGTILSLSFLPEVAWFFSSPLCVSSAWLFTLALGVVATIYYIYNALDDKLQARMLLYVLLVQWLAVQLLIVCFVGHASLLIVLAWTLACPLVAHQLALSRSRWTTAWAVTVLIALVARYICFTLT